MLHDNALYKFNIDIDINTDPAKAVRRNEMPFGRDTRVAPSITVLDKGVCTPREGEIWGSKPPVRSYAAYRQITSTLLFIVFYFYR